MVLVAVCDNDTAEAVFVLLKIGEVRYYQINARHVLVRECKSAVNDEHIVAALVNVEVLADLVKSAERRELHGSIANLPGLLLLRGALAVVASGALRALGTFLALSALGSVGTLLNRLRDCLLRVLLFLHRCESRAVALVVPALLSCRTLLLRGLFRLLLGGYVLGFCEQLVVSQ